MPLYEFTKAELKEGEEASYTTLFFSVKDCPRVGSIVTDDEGVKWKRIFSLPTAGIDTKIDPNSAQDFVDKTAKKKGSVGDLLDKAKELSEIRAKQNGGKDPLQQKYFKDYAKTRKGVQHLEEKRKTKVDKEHFTIEYDK